MVVCFQTFNLNFGFFQFLRRMQLFRKHYLDTIIIIDTYIWQGQIR
jgi:hypothetical protein